MMAFDGLMKLVLTIYLRYDMNAEQSKEELIITLQNREMYIAKLEKRTRFYSSKLKSLRENHYKIYLKL